MTLGIPKISTALQVVYMVSVQYSIGKTGQLILALLSYVVLYEHKEELNELLFCVSSYACHLL